MPRYRALWLQLARDYYESLPEAVRVLADARLGQLLADPREPGHGYDPVADQWTATFGGTGMIFYAVVDAHQRVIVLRLVWLSAEADAARPNPDIPPRLDHP